MEKSEIKNSISKITKDEVLSLKDEIIGLYNMEVYEKNLYFQELRRFDGDIFETVKWLSEQEESHVQILESVLSRANILVKEANPKMPKLSTEGTEVIKMNISNENNAVVRYTTTINKSKGMLNAVLKHIMEEELIHIRRLEKYV
jgi:rubrerythrin